MIKENISESARNHIRALDIGQKVKVKSIFNDNNEYEIVDKKAHPSSCAIDYTLVLPKYVQEFKINKTEFTEDKSKIYLHDSHVGYYNITGDAYFDGDYGDGGLSPS